MKLFLSFFLLCNLALAKAHNIERRGVIEEAGKLFEAFQSGIGMYQ
jgi:hypothetical protein